MSDLDDFEDDDYLDYDDDYDEEDEWTEAESNCGLLPDHLGGGCQNAGTEYCDFDCPVRRAMEEETIKHGEDGK